LAAGLHNCGQQPDQLSCFVEHTIHVETCLGARIANQTQPVLCLSSFLGAYRDLSNKIRLAAGGLRLLDVRTDARASAQDLTGQLVLT